MSWFGKTERKKEEIAAKLKQASKTINGDIHIVPSEGQWAVVKEGAKKALNLFQKKGDAINKATDIAERLNQKERHSTVIVHDNDGTIENTI